MLTPITGRVWDAPCWFDGGLGIASRQSTEGNRDEQEIDGGAIYVRARNPGASIGADKQVVAPPDTGVDSFGHSGKKRRSEGRLIKESDLLFGCENLGGLRGDRNASDSPSRFRTGERRA
jgi:hypothetical protein